MPEVAIVVTAKDKASAVLGKVGGSLQGLGKVAALAGAAGVAALGGIALGAAKLAMDAAKLEPTRITFDNLTASIGSTADAMLNKLRPATMGVVSDADLMQAANKLMAMGLADTEDRAAELAKMAVTLGTAMGKDATGAMEEFSLMLANQSIPRLDTFGISAGKVRERILELMAADASLTREQAFMTAVMEQGTIAMDKVGDVSGTGAVKMAQFRAVIQNLKDTVGAALLPVFHKFLDGILKPLAEKLSELVPKIVYVIETLSLLLNEVLGGDMERAIGFLQAEVWETLDNLFGAEMADKIVALGTKVLEWIGVFRTQVIPIIQDLAARVLPLLRQGIAFVTEHWQTFAKIGAVVGAVLIAISSPITIIIAAIAALALAWMTNWGGIQDKLRAVYDFLEPVFEAIKAALGWVARVVTETVIPALRGLLEWLGSKIAPLFKAFAEEMAPRVSSALQTFGQVLSTIATFVVETVVPALVNFWHGTEGIRQSIVDFMGSAAVMALKGFLAGLVALWDGIAAAIGGVGNAMGWLIGKIQEVIAWLRTLADNLPNWLTGKSASPLETSIRGITDAFRELNLEMMAQPYMARPMTVATVGGGDRITNINLGGVYGAWGPEDAIEQAVRDAARYSL